MVVRLKARALWSAIKKGRADVQEDMMALNALCSAVPPKMVPSITKTETAKETWDIIAIMHDGDDRMKESTSQLIQHKFDMATCGEGETIEDHALCLNSMAAHLTTLGDVGTLKTR
jgi:hypothetical protein